MCFFVCLNICLMTLIFFDPFRQDLVREDLQSHCFWLYFLVFARLSNQMYGQRCMGGRITHSRQLQSLSVNFHVNGKVNVKENKLVRNINSNKSHHSMREKRDSWVPLSKLSPQEVKVKCSEFNQETEWYLLVNRAFSLTKNYNQHTMIIQVK